VFGNWQEKYWCVSTTGSVPHDYFLDVRGGKMFYHRLSEDNWGCPITFDGWRKKWGSNQVMRRMGGKLQHGMSPSLY